MLANSLFLILQLLKTSNSRVAVLLSRMELKLEGEMKFGHFGNAAVLRANYMVPAKWTNFGQLY